LLLFLVSTTGRQLIEQKQHRNKSTGSRTTSINVINRKINTPNENGKFLTKLQTTYGSLAKKKGETPKKGMAVKVHFLVRLGVACFVLWVGYGLALKDLRIFINYSY